MGQPGDSDGMLAALQRVTDTALTKLDLDDLLTELLDRAREILNADTAAVLLLDEKADQLVARAARGLEEEVRQGVRVPVGVGFAGRIAATKGPLRLERVDSTTVANPILWEKNVRVMLGAPLLSESNLLGVIHVGRLENRPFTDEDLLLLQVVADRVAAATQARQLAIEHAAAAMLERSLIPAALPSSPGLQLAARYVPAEQQAVGGDWYDVFTLPSGELWIVVGDVAGHGMQAAVVMGRIRSALRAYTLLDLPPEQVLELVDRKVDHFEIDTIATVACAVLRPPFDVLQIALAGHPPPVLKRPNEPAVLLTGSGDPPLGLASPSRTSSSVPLTPDTVVALYTDGLIERRGESIDAGLDRLLAAVVADAPERVARTVMHQLVGASIPRDDIALVVLRRTDEAGPPSRERTP